MDYRDSAEEAEFRASLRTWLQANVPAGWRSISDDEERVALARDWHKKLYKAGYIGMSWPKEFGGQSKSPVYEAILNEESGRADAPPMPATGYIARALYTYGTDEQRARFLPGLLSGDDKWCQGFSEPNAGSDLAAMRTKAARDGERYVVNGQKMWTSGGMHADWCLLLARTDPTSVRHKGITAFMAHMKSPGVEVRGIRLTNDDSTETCEVFWDDVEIPADQRLGQEGDGWRIAMTTVSLERGPGDVGTIANYQRGLRDVEQLARELGVIDDRDIRIKLAQAYVNGEVLRLNVVEQLSARVSGKLPGPEGSISKQLWTLAEQSLHHAELEMAGPSALTGERVPQLKSYYRSRPVSVYGGSYQIQNNLIAQQLLGMPRAR